jgi:PAS domain S-box-containing protein
MKNSGNSNVPNNPAKKALVQEERYNSMLLAENILDVAREPMLILDMNLRVQLANEAFYRHFQLNENDTIGYKIYDIGNGQWDIPCLEELFEKTRSQSQKITGFTIDHEFFGIGQRSLRLSARQIEHLHIIILGIEVISESGQEEEKLREIGARFNSMINQSTVGIAQADVTGKFTFVNDRFCEITGWTREELLSRHFVQTLTHPDDLPRNIVLLDKLFTKDEPFVIEKRYVKKDGTSIWVVNHVDPILNENGKVTGVSAAVIDISETKKAEIAMRESEERYRLTNKATNDIIYDWDLETNELLWNDAVQSLGYSRGQLGANIKGWYDRIHPEDREGIINDVHRAIDSRDEFWVGEYRFQKSDGTYVTSLDRGYIARDANGKAYRIIGSMLDLTERKKAEQALMTSQEALKKSEEQYRKLFNSIDEGFCVLEVLIDEEGKPVDYRFLETNPIFEEMTGLKQVKGKTALQLVPELEKHWIEIYGKVALTGESLRFINEAKSMDDRWFDVYAFKFGDKDSRKIALLFNNITERKRAEIALKQAKERAENAAKAKEDFLAHMSHEIRTPLNGVLGLTNLLLQQDPKEEQLENLNTLKFSAENLRALVNDILDFSKIQAGKVTLVENDLHLQVFLKTIFKTHQAAALEKGLDIKLDIDENIPELICTDQLKLYQTLQNLLGNAIKFTKKGSIHIDVALNRRDNEKLWIEFSVTDTGIGISPDKLDNIFDVFTQEDSSTMRKFGGTGLGLSISKKLMELMGSRIQVESQLGKGSRFYFTLLVKESRSAVISSGEKEHEHEQYDMDGLSILLVEDVEINRMVLKQFLSSWWKIIPDEALDGEQAIEMAEKKHYDLILMDIRMPVMDGYQATQIIRELPGYKNVPILALTADTAQELKKNPEYGLFTDLILKPVEPQDLRQKLLNYGAEKKVKQNTPSEKQRPVDLQKLDALMKSNPESTKQFLEKVLAEFKRIKQRFSTAMQGQDDKELDNIDHKARMMLNLLSLKSLQDHFQECIDLLNGSPSEKQVEQARVKGINLLDHAIASLKEQLDKMK